MKRGYGELIRRARESRLMQAEDLAARIGQSASTVRRLESEDTEPSVDQINALVAALPLSAEQLLMAMGLRLRGHCLGLLHSADPAAVMWEVNSAAKVRLTADDVAGAVAIWGPPVHLYRLTVSAARD